PPQAESLPARPGQPDSEGEAPISFGPDLKPRAAAVQRAVQPPTPPPTTARGPAEPPVVQRTPVPAVPPTPEESQASLEPELPVPGEFDMPGERVEQATAPAGVQRAAIEPSVETPLRDQAMPLVAPAEPESAQT